MFYIGVINIKKILLFCLAIILIPFIGLSEDEEKKGLEIYKKNKEKEEKFRDDFVALNDDESEENED